MPAPIPAPAAPPTVLQTFAIAGASPDPSDAAETPGPAETTGSVSQVITVTVPRAAVSASTRAAGGLPVTGGLFVVLLLVMGIGLVVAGYLLSSTVRRARRGRPVGSAGPPVEIHPLTSSVLPST